ncbi:DddA-like double-stranded DNA deaminase toxin [Plantactinospora sp. B5E13]|uniref:DddA-like double-stranded DNA deaminase toxin n=1 Tax=unclassified Plantactinospora TaxID=2631981 RepID=UPI00325CBBCE
MALDEIVNSLRSARTRLPIPDLAHARNTLVALSRELGAAIRGSRHAGVVGSVAAAERGRKHLDDAVDRLRTAGRRLDSYLTTITGAGTAVAAPDSPAPAATTADATDIPTPVGPGWVRATVVPDRVRKIGGGFRSRPAGTNRPSAGVFRGSPLQSGGRDRSIAADLVHEPLRGPPVTFYQHVESKAAATMRRDNVTEADLVVDNTVCGTNQRDHDQEWSCAAVLPSILPHGSRLTVWVTRDSGRTWWRTTYLGTGERIRR